MRIELISNEKEIIISNNGPSILPNIRTRIFKSQFVTGKPEGRGLGMYIASQIMRECGGSIALVAQDDERILQGVGFRIKFGNGN